MPIIDRYIIASFLKIFLICFFSFSGLFVIIDAFTNLEEFLKMGKRGNGQTAILGYYGPRVLQFFDRTAPLIALVAAIFTCAMMQRSNEITAIAAAGISKRRIAKPIFLATLVIVVLGALNREVGLPTFRNQLAMNPQDLSAGKGRSFGLTVDPHTGIAIRGKEVMPINQTIEAPEFTLPLKLAAPDENRISAGDGEYLIADENHPNGYLLSHVAEWGDGTSSRASDGETVVFQPADYDWLGQDQIFVASKYDTLRLAFPKELIRNASLSEMIRESREPTSSWSNQHRVDIHWRVLQPIFDMTILLIGLPLVISRGERNLFVSAGICLTVVMLMILVVIASQSLGASRILSPASLAAWLPLIIFLPVAAVTFRMLDR